jgi:predicted nucleic acid-binding Zn ribbon protein
VERAPEEDRELSVSGAFIPDFGGQPVDEAVHGAAAVDDVSTRTDLARVVLAELRAGQVANGRGPLRRRTGGRGTGAENAGRNRGGYSRSGPDSGADPQPVGRLLENFVAEQGWERSLADARVFADWAGLVGADIAAHCVPQTLRDGQLRIAAESTAWATQLRLLSHELLGRLASELGAGVVRTVAISGPVAPSWKHGGRSVRGARGPRDTYG